MPGQLLTLPIRVWARGARLALHVAEDVTELALTNTLRAAGVLANLRARGEHPMPASSMAGPAATARRPHTSAPRARTPRSATPRTRTRAQTPDAVTAPPPPTAAEPTAGDQLASERLEDEGVTVAVDIEATPPPPDHVSEEPVVAREEAEPGAEDGAGASVTVREPWDGYHALGAGAVADRLSAASAEELAAIELYELSHRNRRTVIDAAASELKSRSGRS